MLKINGEVKIKESIIFYISFFIVSAKKIFSFKNIFEIKNVFAGRLSTAELVNRVFVFCELYSGITMYPYQEQFSKRVIRSVLENDGAEITALFSRQSGKSETIATTVGGLMIILPQLANMPMFAGDKRLEQFKDGVTVGIFAPSQRQAQITYGRMKKRLQSKPAMLIMEDPEFNLFFSTSNGQTVSLSNGSFATAISASDGSNIEGESFKVMILEECLVKGTKIKTEFGEKNIEDIKAGEKVYSYNHSTKEVELKKVLRSFKQPLYNRKIYTFFAGETRLECTDNHKVFSVKNNLYKRADEFYFDDEILVFENEELKKYKTRKFAVEERDTTWVYDLTVEDNHNFFAENILVHNCQDISNFKIQKEILPMGAAYNATTIKIGTATTHKGDFYDSIQRNKREDASSKSWVKNHLEFDYRVASKYNPKYAKYVEKQKARLGENSDSFSMAYKLQWVIERGMFIDIRKFELENGEPNLDFVYRDYSRSYVAGIDVGGVNDRTSIAIVEVDWSMPVIMEVGFDEETQQDVVYTAYNSYLVAIYYIENEPDYEEQYPMIMDILSRYNIQRLLIDATREKSLAQRIKANVSFEVVPFVFSSKSKSELYKHFDKEIKAGRFRFAMSDLVVRTDEYQLWTREMSDLQKGYSGSYFVVSHPDTKGATDDGPDAVALAVFASKEEGEVDNTETRGNKFYQKNKSENVLMTQVKRLTGRRR